MKEMILVLCGIFIGRQLMAQTFSEWFRQNHTQLKYLAGQIAALRGYDGALREGYLIGQGGLDSLWSIGEEDLEMHGGRFAALDAPSEAVREHAEVGVIRLYCVLLPVVAGEIETVCGRLPATPLNWPAMGPTIAEKLRKAARGCKDWLDDVLSADGFQMDDAGRLNRMQEISRELRELFGKAMYLLGELEPSPVNSIL